MIKIATAECFTHGKIGLEIHALAQNYKGNFGSKFIKDLNQYGNFDYDKLSVTCSLFIPTIDAVKSILNVKTPPSPKYLIKGIKVYDELGDKQMSKIMAESVQKLTYCDISIGTTAGIGHGAMTILTEKYEITTVSDVYSDLREKNSEELFKRQNSGIEKTLNILLLLLNNKINMIEKIENVEILKK